jgi:NADPH2:quinone reductase
MKIEDVPIPEPGPGQVRIANKAAAVNFVDIITAAGRYQVKPPLPFTPGVEYAGVIDALGEGVTERKVGDRVCTSGFGDGFAEYSIRPAASTVVVPDTMDFPDAATFRVSSATSHYALVGRANLQAGETVLVLGAAGAVGLAAIQIAKALGAKVIASASNEDKRALALDSGADLALDNAAADWRDQIKAFTAGKGVDVVVDPVGGEATERAFRSLGWKGRHLVIGFSAGEIPRLPTNLALLKGAQLMGVDIRQFGIFEPEAAAANVRRVMELHAQGALKPAIAERRPLEDFVDSMQRTATGKLAGRIVLEI